LQPQEDSVEEGGIGQKHGHTQNHEELLVVGQQVIVVRSQQSLAQPVIAVLVVLVPDVANEAAELDDEFSVLPTAHVEGGVLHEGVVDDEGVNEQVEVGQEGEDERNYPGGRGGLEVDQFQDQSHGEVEDHELMKGMEDGVHLRAYHPAAPVLDPAPY
jgi:hypothetical protein